MCVHIADTQGGRDAHARAATVAMSFRFSMPRRMHRARAQPGATDDCMASAWHHERRDSSGWWKGRKSAGGGRATTIRTQGGEAWPGNHVKERDFGLGRLDRRLEGALRRVQVPAGVLDLEVIWQGFGEGS